MKKSTFLVITTVLLLVPSALTEMETVMISELYRHGTRMPYNNVFNAEYFKDGGKLNISAQGVRMHNILGRRVRENY